MGVHELLLKMGSNLKIDNFNNNHIEEVLLFWNRNYCQLNLDLIKNCRPLYIPPRVYLKDDLIDEINKYAIGGSTKNPQHSNIKKRRLTVDVEHYVPEEYQLDTKSVIDFIRKLYDHQNLFIKYKLTKENCDFCKQLIGAIIFRLFKLKDKFLIKHHFDYLSEVFHCVKIPIKELIYIYKILMFNDMIDAHDISTISQNDTTTLKKEENPISKESQISNQNINAIDSSKPTISNLDLSKFQRMIERERYFNRQNLKAFICYSIHNLIGTIKMQTFDIIFSNFKKPQDVLSLKKWSFLLKDYVGIRIEDQNTFNNQEDCADYNIAFGLNSFFEIFTPKYIVSEINALINCDKYLLSKIKEYYEDLNNSIMLNFEIKPSNNIIGIRKELCLIILKECNILLPD